MHAPASILALLFLTGGAAFAAHMPGPPHEMQRLITDDWDPFGDPNESGKPYKNCSGPHWDGAREKWFFLVDGARRGYYSSAEAEDEKMRLMALCQRCIH